ncbi:MAG: hypothetical protein RJA09_417, partial [Pseudomonadota bacterium]
MTHTLAAVAVAPGHTQVQTLPLPDLEPWSGL